MPDLKWETRVGSTVVVGLDSSNCIVVFEERLRGEPTRITVTNAEELANALLDARTMQKVHDELSDAEKARRA